jgi:hypothetical protein
MATSRVAADREREDQPRTQRGIAVEAVAQQPGHHLGTLRVTDQHDPAIGMGGEVGIECRRDIGVRGRQTFIGPRIAARVGPDRDLAIQRHVQVAYLTKRDRLHRGHRGDLGAIRKIRVVAGARGLVDRRVDVETVDRLDWLRWASRGATSIGANIRHREVARAGIDSSRQAEPRAVVAIRDRL